MPFMMQCQKPRCNGNQPYLDTETDKVFCSECDNELTNVSGFAKHQLKMNKQVKTNRSKEQSFSVKCQNCGISARPEIEKKKIICKSCKQELTKISSFFKEMLLETLKNVEKDV